MFTVVKVAAWVTGYFIGARITDAALTAVENTINKITK